MLAKYEVNKPSLIKAFAHYAAVLKLRYDAYLEAGFNNEQAFTLIQTQAK